METLSITVLCKHKTPVYEGWSKSDLGQSFHSNEEVIWLGAQHFDYAVMLQNEGFCKLVKCYEKYLNETAIVLKNNENLYF